MDIGKEKRTIIVEPLENPVPSREPIRTPTPEREPEPTPCDPVPVPVGPPEEGDE